MVGPDTDYDQTSRGIEIIDGSVVVELADLC
jgi:hypothetical protein